MKQIKWNEEKNNILKRVRGIGFEEIASKINKDGVLDIIENSSRENQKMYIIEINDYVYVVPFVESETEIFLKTIYPSRKQKKKYDK
jgi:hypothetical protein